nr:hypothetical protein [Mycolicibacter sinensis]
MSLNPDTARTAGAPCTAVPKQPSHGGAAGAAVSTVGAAGTGPTVASRTTAAHQPAAGTAIAAKAPGTAGTPGAAIAEEARRATSAPRDASLSTVVAGAAVAEQPSAGTTRDVLGGSVGAVADYELAGQRVDKAINLLTEIAGDPTLDSIVQGLV